jgi:hypothetical protein
LFPHWPLTSVLFGCCSIFQERLQRAGEQQADKVDGLNDAAGAAAAEPSVSFFGLIKEGRLSRNQAATLFYQVCGEQEGASWEMVGSSGASPSQVAIAALFCCDKDGVRAAAVARGWAVDG